MDWALRNKLTLIKYWKEGMWETEVSSNFGSNLVLEHLFQMSINLGSIRRLYNSKKCGEIKTYTGQNHMSVSVKNKLQKVMINTWFYGRSIDEDTGIMWENAEGVKEGMEAVLNLVAVDQAIRPH